jgi:tetratricopeptide (TPR) repeat protein
MIKSFCCGLLLLFSVAQAGAQAPVWSSPEVEQLYNQARSYLSSGNLRQAIPIYQQAINLAPDVVLLYRDLANAYYLAGRYELADKTLSPVIESGRADEQCYQIAASSRIAQKEDKKARRILESGIDKFPHSGLLYHEYGKYYDDKNEEEAALKQWLAGIAADPAYRVNYYEAARTYMITSKPVWAILYGELFVNLESQTPRADETRKMLIAAYKKLYSATTTGEVKAFGSNSQEAPGSFEEAVRQTYMKLAPVVSDGISTETLTMLRARFVMDWMAAHAAKYPYSLFSYQDDLLREGHFDAYNQWLFGRAESVPFYDAWNGFHKGAIPALTAWQARRPLQPSVSDSYNEGKTKGIFPQNPYKR